MLPNVYLISGKKYHGKDTVAQMMIDEMVKRKMIGGAKIMSFAEPLKKAAQDIFLLGDDQCNHPQYKEVVDNRWGMTPREIMQKLGTEIARNIHPDVWAICAAYRIKEYLAAYHGNAVFIPDTRFPNEINIPREKLGDAVVTIRVTRYDIEAGKFSDHPSETSLDEYDQWNIKIENKGDIDSLRDKVNSVIDFLQETCCNG